MPKQVWILLVAIFINVTGSSFLWPLNSIYLTTELEKTMSQANLVITLNSVATVIGSLLGGMLFDRLGSYRTIVIGSLLASAACILLAFDHSYYAYIFCLSLLGFGAGFIFPSLYALAALAWPEGGNKTFSMLYVAQNAGVALGSGLGGFIAGYRFAYIFYANAILYAVFTIFVVITFRKMNYQQRFKMPKMKKEPFYFSSSFLALLTLCIAYALCWVAYTQWQAVMGVYMKSFGLPIRQYSHLWILNGLMIVFFQAFVTRIVTQYMPNLKRQLSIGIFLIIISFFTLLFANNYSWFVLAMVIITVGEMLVWPAIPTVANQLASTKQKGYYQGIVNSAATTGKIIGPLLSGQIVDRFGFQVLFIILIFLLFFAMGTSQLYDRKLSH